MTRRSNKVSVVRRCLAAVAFALALLLPTADSFVGRCSRGEIVIYSDGGGGGGGGGGGCQAGSQCPEEETFVTSPGWPRPYPEEARCRYKFVGGPGQRVRVDFLAFNIEGLGPVCEKDFLDVYSELGHQNASLASAPILGRFCGHSLASVPRTVVSVHSILVLDFYTDGNTQKVYNNDNHMGAENALGFKAQYSFVSKDEYEPGTKLSGSIRNCSFIIEATGNLNGVISSPGFPGLYPDNMHCAYVFRGASMQRVRLQFDELDIYEIHAETFGEAPQAVSSCPVDAIQFYDSDSRTRQINTDICGQKPGLTVVSTGNRLRLEFLTGAGRIPRTRPSTEADLRELQRKGFRLRYNISSDFLQLDGDHTLLPNHFSGTECDFLIESSGKSSGRFEFPSVRGGRRCRVFFQGIHNRELSEMVQLKLSRFTPRARGGRCAGLSGLLKMYFRGQSSSASPDAQFCQAASEDRDAAAEVHRSAGPQLFLVFDTSQLLDWKLTPRFTIDYRFVPDFGIPGYQPREDECSFEYISDTVSSGGSTNSPFFNAVTNAHYPHNMTCTYRFVATGRGQAVRIWFTHFYVEDFFIEELGNDKRHHTVGSYVPCAGDRVEVYERYEQPLGSGNYRLEKILTYCGTAIPGPYVTQLDTQELLVKFYSTWDKWTHPDYGKRTATGFKVEYDFPIRTSPFSNKVDVCGGNITSDVHGGVVQVPQNDKATYQKDLICEWHIYPSRPGNRVFAQFPEFHLEGSTKSCSMAILRLYNGDSHVPASEICGADNGIPAFYGRGSEHIRVRLITTAGSRGGKGLKFSWTEALRVDPGNGHCPGFRCKQTGHCIDHRLECNRLPNCGSQMISNFSEYDSAYNRWKNYTKHLRDNSDEEVNSEKCHSIYAKASGPTEAAYQLLHVGIGVIVTVVILIGVVAFVLYREHRRSSSKKRGSGGATLDMSSTTRQLMMPETADRLDGFAAVRNGHSHHQHHQHHHRGYVHSHSTSTLTREKMQKISIV